MKAFVTSMIMLGAVAAATPSRAGVMTFNDAMDWGAAAGAYMTEDFSGAGLTAPGLGVTTDNGYATTTGGGDPYWHDTIDNAHTTTWTFSTPMSSFGAMWNFVAAGFGGSGSGINLLIDGTTIVPVSNTLGWDFFGFVSDTPFTTVQEVSANDPGVQEVFGVAYLSYAAPVAAVPEPSTWALLIVGFGSIGLLSWRKRRVYGLVRAN